MTKPKSTARKLAQRTINQAKAAARIEEVVGDFVSLKRRGSNLVGLCPFHEDHTPSFYVSPAKGKATCFSCGNGESRDAIQFLRDHESMTFNEAIEYLAKRYGIPIEYEHDDAASVAARQAVKTEEKLRHEIMEVSKRAEDYFVRTLYLPEHVEVLTYIHERGISDETLHLYGVGYATRADQGMGMVRAALKAGCTPELLVDAGLAYSPQKARFINRVMFPIRRGDGRTVGFGGRILPSEPDKQALKIKYLNTCETLVYKKHTLLFGLDIAHQAIRLQKRAYICEGYMDVLAMHEAGVRGAVAACGTAFTAEQARLLAHSCSTAVLCYDGDTAGAKACVSAMKVLLDARIIPEVFVAPAGSDPASLLLAHGHGLSSFIDEHTVSYLEYLVGDCTVASSSPSVYKEVITRTAEVIACVRDAVVKDQAVRWVADRTGGAVKAVEDLVVSESAQVATLGGANTSHSDLLETIAPPNPRLALEASIVALLKECPCQAFLDFVREEIVEDGASMQSVDIAEVLAALADSDVPLLSTEEMDDRGDMLQDLVLGLKNCVVLEEMGQEGCDWEMWGEMKVSLEEMICPTW